MRKLSLLILIVFIALPARTSHSQNLDIDNKGLVEKTFLFDDFSYTTNPEFEDSDNQTEASGFGSIYGINEWYYGTNTSSIPTQDNRSWYASSWFDPANARLSYDTYNDFKIQSYHSTINYISIFADSAQTIDGQISNGRLVELSSGFVARSGTWAVKARVGNFGDNIGSGNLNIIQAPLWLKTVSGSVFSDTLWRSSSRKWDMSFQDESALTSVSPRASKYDPEINFELVSSTLIGNDPNCDSYTCHVSPGVLQREITNLPLGQNPTFRENPNSSSPGCRVGNIGETWPQATSMNLQQCKNILTRINNDVWATYMLQMTDNKFTLHILVESDSHSDNFAWLYMGTDHQDISNATTTQVLPSQNYRAMISTLISAGNNTIDDQSLDLDWFYYTPNTSISMHDINGDVSKIRHEMYLEDEKDSNGDQVRRINTTGFQHWVNYEPSPCIFPDLYSSPSQEPFTIEGPFILKGQRTWQVIPNFGPSHQNKRHGFYHVTWNYEVDRFVNNKSITVSGSSDKTGVFFSSPYFSDETAVRVSVDIVDLGLYRNEGYLRTDTDWTNAPSKYPEFPSQNNPESCGTSFALPERTIYGGLPNAKRLPDSSNEIPNPELDLSVFPSPSSDSITLEYYAAADASIEVYNVLGQRVAEFQVETGHEDSIQSRKLDVSSFAEGAYFARIHTADSSYYTSFLVIR